MSSLTPSLWKTCRVLANAKRVRLFRLLDDEGKRPANVWHVRASFRKMSLGTCSLYLKHLQARGLLRFRREGVQVFYSVSPDSKVPQAAGVVATLRACFRAGWTDAETAALFNALRNPGHVAIVVLLQSRRTWVPAAEIRHVLGYPAMTFLRYRNPLLQAGLIEMREGDGALRIPSVLVRPARLLLGLVGL